MWRSGNAGALPYVFAYYFVLNSYLLLLLRFGFYLDRIFLNEVLAFNGQGEQKGAFMQKARYQRLLHLSLVRGDNP